MEKKFKYSFLIFILIFSVLARAQNKMIDSLKNVLKTEKEDTNKINALNNLAWELKNNNPDTSINLSTQALKLSEKINFESGVGVSCHQLGVFNRLEGDYSKALHFYFKALNIWEKLYPPSGKQRGASTLGNIGLVYSDQGDYSQALVYYIKALKTDEELGEKKYQAVVLGNIGIVYKEQGDYIQALDYYFKALKIDEGLGNKTGIARHLGNIGLVYMEQGNYPEALEYYFKALKMDEDLGNKNYEETVLGNIGNIYFSESDYSKALEYGFRALKMAEEIGDKNGIARHSGNIGSSYFKTGKFKEAEEYLKNSIALYDEIGAIDGTRDFENAISQLYDTTGRVKLAFEHYKKYIAARDSFTNDENTKKQTQIEMQYEFDKKTTSDSIRNAEHLAQENLKHNQEIQQQKIYTYGGAIGFLLMIVVAGVSFRAYKSKQKANEIIFKQKELVEEKQKQVLDSIHYAKRIQQSLLPTEKYIEKHLSRKN